MERIRSFLDRLSSLTLSVEDMRERGLRYWRERVFSYALGAMSILGLVALIPSVWLSFVSGFIALGIFDIVAYLAIVALLLLRRQIRYEVRAAAVLFIGLSIGVIVFYVTGDEGAGLFWMFMVPPLASILLGLQWGFALFMINFAFIMVTGYLVVLESHLLPGLLEFGLGSWMVYAVNFLVTNALITFPLGALLNGLFFSAEREKKLVADYRILFDSNPLPMWVYDLENLNFLAVNDAAVDHYGYSYEEFLRMTIKDIRPAEEVAKLEQNLARESSNKQQSGPWKHHKKDGSIIEVDVYSHAISFGDKAARLVLVNDVTIRNQAQAKLQLSDEILQRVKSLILVMTSAGELIYVSPSSEEILGYKPDELLGDGWWQKTHEAIAEAEAEKNSLKYIISGVIPISSNVYERAIKTRSGDVKWVEWSDAIGPNETLIGVGRDITERKKAERELRLNMAKLDETHRFNETIIAASPVGILAYEADSGQCIIANEAASQLVGATREQMLAQNFRQLQSWKTSGFFAAAEEALKERTSRALDSNLVTTFGKTVYLHANFSTFYLENKLHLLLTVSDISELKAAEQSIRRRLTELEAVKDVSVGLRAALRLEEMLPLLLDTTLRVLGLDRGAIWLYDPDADLLRVALARGYVAQDGSAIEVLPEKPGTGLAGRIFATGLIHMSKDYASDPHFPEAMRNRIPSGIGGVEVPLRAEGQVIGILTVNTMAPRELDQDEVNVVTTLAEMAGNAIQRSRLHQKTEQQLELFRTLNEVDRIILSSFDLKFNLQMITARVVEQLNVDASNILIYEPVTQMLTSNEGTGFTNADFQGKQVLLGDGFAGRAAAERKTLRVENLRKEDINPRLAKALAGERFTTYLAVPLVAKGELRGVMEIFHSKPLPRDEDWLGRVDALAGRAAIAIDTLKVFENLERSNKELLLSYDAAIEGWSRALDLRDKETEGHSQRVTELAVNLARSMGMKGKELINLSRGALLHDIGKMGVSDNILRKEGALTEEEWVAMRKHPTYARDMLESIGYLQDAIDVPYGHHEKWDGSGYPRGLQGEQIPLAARIFAVADVYDALTSDRPYRKAWTREKTIEYIRNESGKHFDPRVVEAFLALETEQEFSARAN